jgi:voltage-gated potassium channel
MPLDPRTPTRLRKALSDPLRQLQASMLLLFVLVGIGTLGFRWLEGMSWPNALYMTVITISTVGFNEIQPLSETTRMFTIGLIAGGVGIGAWALARAIEVLLGPSLWRSFRTRRMLKNVENLRDHYIVCGYGRLGSRIVRDLQARQRSIVVVEQTADYEEALLDARIAHIIGDATHDEVLMRAGVERARGLVSALDTDAGNVLTAVTARDLNPELLIVCRATSEAAERKLRRAGADRVVTPESMGAHRLALALLRPAVHDFFDRVLTFGDDPSADLGEINVDAASPLAGRAIGEAALQASGSVSILAVRSPEGEFLLNPSSSRIIQAGETLIIAGPAGLVHELERHGVDGAR